MEQKHKSNSPISRRRLLPLMGLGLILPFFGMAKPSITDSVDDEDSENYQTLIKPDGTAVKIKTSALNKSKVVKENLSNKSLLSWLGKKL